jgi:hypothetical protein
VTDLAIPSGVGAMDSPGDPALELLRKLGGADPRLQMFAELLRRRQLAPPAPDGSQADLERMTARCERLREAGRALRARNDLLASALGACARCWGEDEECPLCDGRGLPGAFQPRPDAFEACVLPAVRRYRPWGAPGLGREPESDARRHPPSASDRT